MADKASVLPSMYLFLVLCGDTTYTGGLVNRQKVSTKHKWKNEHNGYAMAVDDVTCITKVKMVSCLDK